VGACARVSLAMSLRAETAELVRSLTAHTFGALALKRFSESQLRDGVAAHLLLMAGYRHADSNVRS